MIVVGLVTLAAVAAACVQAAAGLGFALILTPVLFVDMRPTAAILTVTVLGILLNLLVLFAERRRPIVAARELAPALLAAVPGSVCGIIVLQNVSKGALQVAIGVIVIAAVVLRSLPRPERTPPTTGRAPSRWPVGVGFVTGVLSTSTGVTGPPLALWLTSGNRSRHHVRDALSVLFLGTGAITLITLVPLLPHAHLAPVTMLAAAAGVIAGHAAGSRIFTRLTGHWFTRGMFLVILASGVTSLALGLGSL